MTFKCNSVPIFWQALTDYRAELRDDPIINTHLAKLYDNLLEQNLIRVIEPFSRVQVRTLLGTRAPLWLGIPMAPLLTHTCPQQELTSRMCLVGRDHQEIGTLFKRNFMY